MRSFTDSRWLATSVSVRSTPTHWDPYQEFLAWRKRQTVDTVVVEIARENRDQLAIWLAEHGGRIVGGAK